MEREDVRMRIYNGKVRNCLTSKNVLGMYQLSKKMYQNVSQILNLKLVPGGLWNAEISKAIETAN